MRPAAMLAGVLADVLADVTGCWSGCSSMHACLHFCPSLQAARGRLGHVGKFLPASRKSS
jgi:hypothetical protein